MWVCVQEAESSDLVYYRLHTTFHEIIVAPGTSREWVGRWKRGRVGFPGGVVRPRPPWPLTGAVCIACVYDWCATGVSSADGCTLVVIQGGEEAAPVAAAGVVAAPGAVVAEPAAAV